MYIREYLKQQGLKHAEFADNCEISRGYLRDVMYGKKVPSKRLCKIIEMATGGLVSAQEVLVHSYDVCPCCGQATK